MMIGGHARSEGLTLVSNNVREFQYIEGLRIDNLGQPLRDWFKLAHLLLAAKEIISARQLWRYMGFGSLKTAWYTARRLRSALH